MAADRLSGSTLSTALTNVLSDMGVLVQKELQLAKAEFSSKLTTKLRGGVWMLAAAALLFLAGAVFSGALAIWISTFGIALHLACFGVGAALLALASIAFIAGRTDVSEDLAPTRAIHRTTKEQLS